MRPMRQITLKGGPRDGKTYLVPADQSRINDADGHYALTKKQATWQPTNLSKQKNDSPPESQTPEGRGVQI